MKNNRPDDIRFLINTFSTTLIIVAILVTFQPYMENEPRLEEVRYVEQHIVTVDPQDLSRMIKSDTGKPVMLVAYASWCYFCRQVMPVVTKMIRNHELDDVTPVFISLDDQPRKLSRYLVHNEYNTLFASYVVGYGLSREISGAMQPSGSSFTGIIPYVGFFDKNGKLRAESTGIVNERQLSVMVQKLRNTN